MADRLDRFIDLFSEKLLGQCWDMNGASALAMSGVGCALEEAKAALAEEDLSDQLIESGKQALEYALNVESKNNKFSDQPAEEKPKTADDGPRPGQSMREWMEKVYQRIGTAEEDQAAEEKPHPNAVEWEGSWFRWIDGLHIWNGDCWLLACPTENNPLIARAKAAAGVE